MDRDRSAAQPLLDQDETESDGGGGGGAAGRLLRQQRRLAGRQDLQLERIGTSVGTLRSMSRQIGAEVDEQAVMIDDISHDVDSAQGRMDTTMVKMAKVLRITNDRRQWIAIAVLSGILFIVILLFFVL